MTTSDMVPYGFVVNGKWYIRCARCKKLVRIDKPIFGSLHICTE